MKKSVVFISLAVLLSLTSCANYNLNETSAGGLLGAALGAGAGAIIGNQTGNSGAGVAIGAALGGASGAAFGYGKQKTNDEIRKTDSALNRQEQQIAENQKILDQLKKRGLDASITSQGIVVNLPDVLFEFGSDRLTRDAVSKVGDITGIVKSYPKRDLIIAGHTDSVGTMEYNQKLSEDRARKVSDELVYQGVSRSRIFAKGYGESRPVDSNSTQSGRAKNRRVEVLIKD